MDKGTQSLLNVLLSVLAPVMVLDHCSVSGPELWQLGTTAAMCVALSLPLGFGVWTFAQCRRVEPLTLFGLLGCGLVEYGQQEAEGKNEIAHG